MVVRELVALLGVKTDQASVKKAEGGLNSLINKAKALAVAYLGLKGVQVFKSIIQEVATAADWMDKMSKRTGLSTQSLERLGYAAGLSGASLQAIENSVRKLQTAQVDADAGLQTYTREFKRLGVEVKDSKGEFKDAETLLADVADGIKGLSSDAERSAVAMKLMGRQGTQLLPMLKEGGDAVRAMAKELDDLGGTMSQDMVDAGAKFIDNQLRISTVFKSIKIAIAKDFIPWANRASEAFVEWWKVNKDWVRAGVVNTLKTFGRVFIAVKDAVMAVINPVIKLWESFNKTEKSVVGIIAAIGLIQLALSQGPIGALLLVISLIALIIEDFQVWREGGKSVIGDIIAKINEFLGIDIVAVIKEWGGYFVGTIQTMIETVMSFIHFWVDVFTVGPAKALENLVERLKIIWGAWAEDFKEPIRKVAEFFERVFTAVGDWFQKNVADKIKKFFTTGVVGKVTAAIGGVFSTVDNMGGVSASAGSRTAQPRVGGAGSSVQQNMKMDTVINAAPGMSEKKIGQEVEAGVRRAMEKQNREALKTFVPKAG